MDIVPFGKYKGLPLSALGSDKPYCEWLMSQAWFSERYGEIKTVIVNNFTEAAETPEHNALQSRFTDQSWCLGLAALLLGGRYSVRKYFSDVQSRVLRCLEGGFDRRDSRAEVIEIVKCAQCSLQMDSIEFEVKGADAVLKVKAFPEIADLTIGQDRWWLEDMRGDVMKKTWRIECKPSFGDDYPAILRQMKANNCHVLLVGDGGYHGTGATLESVEFMFNQSKIMVCFKHAVDALLMEK